jgi:hypothetical protein
MLFSVAKRNPKIFKTTASIQALRTLR